MKQIKRQVKEWDVFIVETKGQKTRQSRMRISTHSALRHAARHQDFHDAIGLELALSAKCQVPSAKCQVPT